MTVDYHKADISYFSIKKTKFLLRLIIQVNLCDMLIKFWTVEKKFAVYIVT